MNTVTRTAIGLVGINIVIIVHEFGHFLACKLFAIATPLFSIGFGPTILAYRIGDTLFRIAAFPIGGYVAITQNQLDAAPYLIKVIILLAGVFANFLFSFGIFMFFKLRNIDIRRMAMQASHHVPRGIMGPIGIIATISYSASLGFSYFLLVLGALSISIGIFNLFPIPFFDGGQIAWYTIEAIVGPLPDTAFNFATLIFFGLFLLFLLFVSLKDVRQLKR